MSEIMIRSFFPMNLQCFALIYAKTNKDTKQTQNDTKLLTNLLLTNF